MQWRSHSKRLGLKTALPPNNIEHAPTFEAVLLDGVHELGLHEPDRLVAASAVLQFVLALEQAHDHEVDVLTQWAQTIIDADRTAPVSPPPESFFRHAS